VAAQQIVADAESRGARTDTEFDDQNGKGRESGVPAQRSKRVTQVLQDAAAHGQPARVSMVAPNVYTAGRQFGYAGRLEFRSPAGRRGVLLLKALLP